MHQIRTADASGRDRIDVSRCRGSPAGPPRDIHPYSATVRRDDRFARQRSLRPRGHGSPNARPAASSMILNLRSSQSSSVPAATWNRLQALPRSRHLQRKFLSCGNRTTATVDLACAPSMAMTTRVNRQREID